MPMEGPGQAEWQGTSLRIWVAGFRVGLSALSTEPALAVRRLILPVSYWRTAEFGYACSRLQLPSGSKVLDVGSPKDLAAFLARYRNFEVVATDILARAVELSERLAVAQGLNGVGPGKVTSEVQDGRRLPYPANSFDAVFSVSVLEHIPEGGDSETIGELVRVVRPGGRIVFTVPFDEKYRETFVNRPVYERSQDADRPVFYERHYDETALQTRLLAPSQASLIELEYWGESDVRIDRMLHRHRLLRRFLSPGEALLSSIFLRKIEQPSVGHRMAAFVTLQKPS